MKRRFEREFLKQLAATWLAARWRVMGGQLYGVRSHGAPNLAFDLLGMMDYAAEMQIVCEACRKECAAE